MSPAASRGHLTWPRFPRVSGDEPLIDSFDRVLKPFSPRERG